MTLFPDEWVAASRERLVAAHNRQMHDALVDYMRALAVTISQPGHPLFVNSAGYRQALEDISRAIDPLAEATTNQAPG